MHAYNALTKPLSHLDSYNLQLRMGLKNPGKTAESLFIACAVNHVSNGIHEIR